MTKRLKRSKTDKIIAGVFGGVGEYFDTDPVLIRLAYAVITVFTGFIPGVIGYLLAILIVPSASYIAPSAPITEEKVVVDDAEKV